MCIGQRQSLLTLTVVHSANKGPEKSPNFFSRDGQLILQRQSVLDVAQGSKYIQALSHHEGQHPFFNWTRGSTTVGEGREIKADGKTKGLLGICLSKPFL